MKTLTEKYKSFLDLVIYQVYPRSFKDTNGDGIGDIRGITEKLDYLKELGINAIWLCPCYKSPNHDNGYDIADYRDIMDEFGTLDDIKEFISEMHKREMKLIMDLVPNHTSSEHEWFKASRKRQGKYTDYYYWSDKPLNDWLSRFGGSAWQFDEERGQYYLHSYAVQQPDLNWNNPQVVEEIQQVVDFWLDMGVDGFRCDVIDQISKDFENNRNCFGPRLHEFIHDLFGRKNTEGIFTVGECWAEDIDEVYRHCAPERGELSTLFQFEHFKTGRLNKYTRIPADLKFTRDVLVNWQLQTQEMGLLYSLFTDNHDQSLFISRAADDTALRYESATCLATMFYLLRGIPFIYQGQEIGITASSYNSIESFADIECKNAYKGFLAEGMTPKQAMDKINFGNRDNPRRPFAWDNSQYHGFSTHKPWLECASRADEINLENDLKSEKSVFRFYKELLKLRRENPALRSGEFAVLSKKEDNFFVYTRELDSDKFTVVCNFNTEAVIPVDAFGTEVLKNYADRISGTDSFRPYEIAVFKS